MNTAENNLVQSFTGKPSLQEVTVEELKEITGKYPYFSLGQLLLAKKLKQSNPESFIRQLQYCTTYFQDIRWLLGQVESRAPVAYFGGTANNSNKGIEEQYSTGNTAIASGLGKGNIETSNLITLPADGVLESFTLVMNDVKEEPELPPLDEEELAAVDDITSSEAAAKIADVLQHQVEEFKAPLDEETNLPISTEPFHTVDYFASQGIKVDAHAQDTFTKKVHTFTDWLKQMKRISNYPTDLGSDPEMENYVQSIADTSNQAKAVDTEAMAEVLVKQGKLDKAIEVYEKLSLHNPSKTAYFAAKINYLKGI